MRHSDDDDDTHFCIKCHTTIAGLQNYVDHRTAKCRALASPSSSKKGLAEDDYFFTSLCLKSTSSSGSAPSGKPSVGIMTRSKIVKNKKEEGKREESDFDGVSYDELQENVQSYLSEPLIGMEESEMTEDESDDDGGTRWMHSLWPPPSHTGGKWKPSGSPAEEPEGALMPPPEHTQGKWGPSERVPARKTHYWCSPCDRRLSSKLAYNKHVKSQFHLKRTNNLNPSRSTDKRKRKPSRKMLEASAKVVSNKLKAKRLRSPRGPIVCPVCCYKVWPHLMGKHLVSHYHCRRPGDKAVSNALVLKEMGSIVRQAPFQCGLCKFYCNSSETFMTHWNSEMHLRKDEMTNGVYFCGFCSVKTTSTGEMSEHLIGESHRGVVAVVNNSLPIIIYRRTRLTCWVCKEVFRFNAQIRSHAKRTNHIQLEGTAADDYQERIKCGLCSNVSHSKIAHQRHLRAKHNALEYFCRPCNLKFATTDDARKHRKTAVHFDVASREPKRCMHCEKTCDNLGQLKRHIDAEHPERKSRCVRCGALFPLKQMLSRHVKEGKCPGRPHKSQTGKLACSSCSFSCDNQFELIVHTILHREASPCGTYECPKCRKRIKKESLRKHVRKHKFGIIHSCRLCFAMFNDWSTLMEHVKDNHDQPSQQEGASENTPLAALHQIHHWGDERERRYKCPDCPASFFERAVLSRHSQIHRGKKLQCDRPDCIFTARSNWELSNHARTHSGDRTFHCQFCPYSSKTKAQLTKHVKGMHLVGAMKGCPHCDFTTQHSTHLKRHLRIHSGVKPYKCPYCNYTCNLLENLRKHVVNSKKHPNKRVYECRTDGCAFECNHAKDYKIHLVQEHGEDKSKAASFVAGLYRPEQDIAVSGSQIIEGKRKKPPKDTSDELVDDATVSTVLATTASTSNKRNSAVFIRVEEPDEFDARVAAFDEEFIVDDSFDVDGNEIELVARESGSSLGSQ